MASELCNHPKSWKADDISVLALSREDLLLAGGLFPQVEFGEKQVQAEDLLLNTASYSLIDLFFRARAYAGLSIVRPSDPSVFVTGPAAQTRRPDLPQELGLGALTNSLVAQKGLHPRHEWKLKKPASFQTSLPTYGNYTPEYSFDEREGTFFWSSRAPQKDDYFQLDLQEPILCKEVHVRTGSRKQLFNWLRLGFFEVSPDGVRFKKVFVFLQTSNGVARVEFKHGLKIKSLRLVVAQEQDAWLVIEDITLFEDM